MCDFFCHWDIKFFILFSFLDQVAWLDGVDFQFSIRTFCPPCFLGTASRLNPHILSTKDVTTNVKGFFSNVCSFFFSSMSKNDEPWMITQAKESEISEMNSLLYLLTLGSWTMAVMVTNYTRVMSMVILKTQGNNQWSGVKRLYDYDDEFVGVIRIA